MIFSFLFWQTTRNTHLWPYLDWNYCCRIEKVNLKSMSGRTKVLGSFTCIGGALLLGLYKGIPLTGITTSHHKNSNTLSSPRLPPPPSSSSSSQWAIGSVLLTGGCLLWASWFLIQDMINKRYPFQYSSTAILSLFGSIQSAVLNLIINRKNNYATIWILHGKLQILTVVYAVSLFILISFEFYWNLYDDETSSINHMQK